MKSLSKQFLKKLYVNTTACIDGKAQATRGSLSFGYPDKEVFICKKLPNFPQHSLDIAYSYNKNNLHGGD
jgi:hypothetical protein